MPESPTPIEISCPGPTAPTTPAQAVTHTFPRAHRSVPLARNALRTQLDAWHLTGELADAALLVLSELVTNAVRAPTAGSRNFRVRFERTAQLLRLEVADGCQGRPSPRRAGRDDECGRGLGLVEALADRWGTEPLTGTGKTVWAQWHLLPLSPTADTRRTVTDGSDAPSRDEILREAEHVHRELAAALHGAGITLPSLRVSTLTYAEDSPRPLIELGGCNLHTARTLTATLRTQQTRPVE